MVNLPRVSIDTDRSAGLCFGCGPKNPIGLKLSFQQDGKMARAEFIPDQLYQGWRGIVHGGIIATALDEALSHAAHFDGVECITAEMAVRFKRPARVEEPLIITAFITRKTRKLIKTEAKAVLKDGTVVAEGTATQFIVERISGDVENSKTESRDNA